jgi:cyd operon protein YbgE
MTQTPENRGAGYPRHWLYSFAARSVSFLMAVALSVLILIYPKAVASSATEINHGILSLWMWGMAAGFVHGVGFVPEHRVWRMLLGPLPGWILMTAGLIYVFMAR